MFILHHNSARRRFFESDDINSMKGVICFADSCLWLRNTAGWSPSLENWTSSSSHWGHSSHSCLTMWVTNHHTQTKHTETHCIQHYERTFSIWLSHCLYFRSYWLFSFSTHIWSSTLYQNFCFTRVNNDIDWCCHKVHNSNTIQLY